ncbi:MAG: hypothetical protein WKF30_19155 [Pyrinomonadaceae bacterium]
MQGIAILGSTGSIGRNTLRVVDCLSERFRVVAIGARRNVKELAEQIARYRPEVVSVETEASGEELARAVHGLNAPPPRIVCGELGLVEVATHEAAACVVSATVGAVGLVPTLRALEAGKRVALANKETLVMAGAVMQSRARIRGRDFAG